MKENERNIHRNGVDIIQRLMAKNMIGEQPLKALSVETAKVKEVLSTDLPAIQTKDDEADTLYLLEDGTYLHVEYQTTAKKEDVVRFAWYVLGLYTIYKENAPTFRSVVVYAPHIAPESVVNKLDTGGFHYRFEPVFLRDLNLEDRYQEVLKRIQLDPAIQLSDEEKMVIVYRPLANSETEAIEKDSLRVIRDLLLLEDDSERAKLGSSIFVLLKKYLSDQTEKQILEELFKMDVVKEWYEEKHKADLKASLIKTLKNGASMEVIQPILEDAHFTPEEVEEIRKEAQSE